MDTSGMLFVIGPPLYDFAFYCESEDFQLIHNEYFSSYRSAAAWAQKYIRTNHQDNPMLALFSGHDTVEQKFEDEIGHPLIEMTITNCDENENYLYIRKDGNSKWKFAGKLARNEHGDIDRQDFEAKLAAAGD
jgi:hypothetical protein